MPTFEKDVVILNKLGLHARAATQLVKLATQYQAKVVLQQGDKTADADSVLGLMMLESSQGKAVKLIANGDDAEDALLAIEALIVERFYEEE